MITRRQFIKYSIQGIAAIAAPLGAMEMLRPGQLFASGGRGKLRWVFVIDTKKCVGCGFCVSACKLENEIPYEANASRTWVERYVITKDRRVFADSPKAGRDGFINNDPMGVNIDKNGIEKAFFVPKLCNQCDNPPCVQVCPVGATYQTDDGIVLVDREWCIGCGYCIMACPYGVRFFHPVYKTAEKCNFCYHRIGKGLLPACVDACPFKARLIGNIADPEDPVAKIIRTERVAVLKDEFGTRPSVYYLNFDLVIR